MRFVRRANYAVKPCLLHAFAQERDLFIARALDAYLLQASVIEARQDGDADDVRPVDTSAFA